MKSQKSSTSYFKLKLIRANNLELKNSGTEKFLKRKNWVVEMILNSIPN